VTKKLLTGDAFEALLCDFLDIIVQDPHLQRASRAVGRASKWIWAALKRSGENDPKYLVRWPDRECEKRIQFGEAVALARRLHKVQFDATLRSAVDIGIPEIQTFQGDVIWKKDGALLTEWGGDTMEAREAAERLGGIIDYPYEHRMNAQGKLERVPLEIYKPAPGALRQHVARSLIPSEFNPPEVRSISTEHSGAVLILNAHKPAYAKDYKPDEAPAPDTPIRRDLMQRLADLRAKGPAHPLPLDKDGRRTIPKLGTPAAAAHDPPERVGFGPVPQVDADGHIVGAKAKPMIGRDGTPAPGGFSAITGRPT
jgi:hypothetical protein